MNKYKNLQNTSSVAAYEYGSNWIRVQFTSGTIRMYTYKNAGWLNVEAMKKCADKGEGLSSYIYGPFGYRALLSKLTCKFLWLRQINFISFIGRKINFALTPYHVFVKYNSRYTTDNTKYLSEDNKSVNNSSEFKSKKIHINFEANESVPSQTGSSKQSTNEELYIPNSNYCVARLLGALKSIPETFSTSL